MQRFYKASCFSLAIASLILATPYRAYAQDLADRFHNAYSNLKSVSCTFEGGYGLSGSLVAAKGKGYRIELPTRVITSNNKLVWNAEKNSKTVIVNKYNASNSDVSLDQVFFVLFNVYAREVLPTSNKSNQLRLFPSNTSAKIAGVSEVIVELTPTLSVSRISVTQDGNTSHWKIQKIQRNVLTSSKSFVYEVPRGWTLVDLTK